MLLQLNSSLYYELKHYFDLEVLIIQEKELGLQPLKLNKSESAPMILLVNNNLMSLLYSIDLSRKTQHWQRYFLPN